MADESSLYICFTCSCCHPKVVRHQSFLKVLPELVLPSYYVFVLQKCRRSEAQPRNTSPCDEGEQGRSNDHKGERSSSAAPERMQTHSSESGQQSAKNLSSRADKSGTCKLSSPPPCANGPEQVEAPRPEGKRSTARHLKQASVYRARNAEVSRKKPMEAPAVIADPLSRRLSKDRQRSSLRIFSRKASHALTDLQHTRRQQTLLARQLTATSRPIMTPLATNMEPLMTDMGTLSVQGRQSTDVKLPSHCRSHRLMSWPRHLCAKEQSESSRSYREVPTMCRIINGSEGCARACAGDSAESAMCQSWMATLAPRSTRSLQDYKTNAQACLENVPLCQVHCCTGLHAS